MFTSKDIDHRKLILIQPFGPLDVALKVQTGNLLMTKDNSKVDKIPLSSILAIFIIGRLTVTTQLLHDCSDYGVSVFFLSDSFSTYARCGASIEGNYLLRQKQYLSSPEEELRISKDLIAHKTLMQNSALKYFKKTELPSVKIEEVSDRESLLGVEGNMSAKYFSSLFETMGWYRRLPQAKPDEINLLMDMGYTMLFNLCDALLTLFGFDTYKGVYHQLFFARKSLVCDIMEPWRVLIDASILLMYRQNIFNKKDFKVTNSSYTFAEGFRGRSKYARVFLKALTSHKTEMFNYIKQLYLHVSRPEKHTLSKPVLNFERVVISSNS